MFLIHFPSGGGNGIYEPGAAATIKTGARYMSHEDSHRHTLIKVSRAAVDVKRAVDSCPGYGSGGGHRFGISWVSG